MDVLQFAPWNEISNMKPQLSLIRKLSRHLDEFLNG